FLGGAHSERLLQPLSQFVQPKPFLLPQVVDFRGGRKGAFVSVGGFEEVDEAQPDGDDVDGHAFSSTVRYPYPALVLAPSPRSLTASTSHLAACSVSSASSPTSAASNRPAETVRKRTGTGWWCSAGGGACAAVRSSAVRS